MENISGLPDFWQAHPDAEAVEVFRVLREKRENAGSILYFFKFLNDPASEILRHLKPDDRKVELKKWLGIDEKDLMNSKGQVYKYVQDCEDWYLKNWIDPTARLLNAHTQKVFESAKVVEEYSVDSFEKMAEYSKAIETFQTIKETYDKMLQMFKTQEAVKKKHGGGEISGADDNSIFEGIE